MRRVMLWRHHERHRRFSVDLRDCSTIMIRLTLDATRSVTYSMKTIYCILSPSISVFSPKILTPKMFGQVKQQVCSNIYRNFNIDWKLNICQVISNFLDTHRTPASSCRKNVLHRDFYRRRKNAKKLPNFIFRTKTLWISLHRMRFNTHSTTLELCTLPFIVLSFLFLFIPLVSNSGSLHLNWKNRMFLAVPVL